MINMSVLEHPFQILQEGYVLECVRLFHQATLHSTSFIAIRCAEFNSDWFLQCHKIDKWGIPFQ